MCPQIAAGLSLLFGLSLIAGEHQEAPKPQTPSEQVQDLVKGQREAQKKFSDAYQSAKTDAERKQISETLGAGSTSSAWAPRFLKLVRKYPTDPAALDAFRWLVAHEPDNTPTQEAAKLVAENWAGSDKVEAVCRSLKYYHCAAGATVLHAAIAKNTHRSVQGYARYSLALYLKYESDRSGSAAPDRFAQEAEELLEEVIRNYGDLPENPGPTLNKFAEGQLFELRHLSIGRAAPDIEGEDIDGKKFKLSDYRGKIVLLNFWGSW